MAKKREDRAKGKKINPDQNANLDGDFISPVKSFRDLSFKNIRAVIYHSRYVQILLSLTVIGFFLRFYHISFNSLWLDEATTLNFSKPGFLAIWNISRTADFHPPLFHWIEHIMLIFGQSEFVLRAVPALLGVLTIPVLYLIGKEFHSRDVGLIAAALLTFSPFALYYSQEAYSYSLVLFAFSIVILFYLLALRTDKICCWVLFGITSAIAFWTHYYVFVGLGVIYLHAIFSLRERLKKGLSEAKHLLTALSITIILVLPLLFIVGERFFTLTGSPPTYGVLGPLLIQETFIRFSGGYTSLSATIGVIFLVLMIGGLVYLFTQDRNKGLFSAMFVVLPIVFSVLISSKMTMNPRYLIYLLPVFFVLIAMCYPYVFRLIPNRNLLYLTLVLVVAINAPLLAEYYTTYTNEDWRGFAGIVQAETHDGDLVVVVPGYVAQPFDYYYSNASDKTFEYGANTGATLENISLRRGNSSIFYVVTGDITAEDPQGDALKWLTDNAQIDTERTGVYLLKSR